MVLHILKTRSVGDVQHDFSQEYPYLRMDFFKQLAGKHGPSIKQKVVRTAKLSASGKLTEGELEIHDSMTVGQLESVFRERFGINMQVSRKSGPVWLETTVTDKWTLKQQNEHGRELSVPVKKILPEDELDFD
ncbi:MAG TPA: hypothetical protein VFD56_15465 [Chitinophagaceae bacterium]|nr:hypothetical protein [Chitinophagaceae bacterium]